MLGSYDMSSILTRAAASWALALVLAGCQGRGHPGTEHGHRPPQGDPLPRVASIHGAAGPFAVAGFRMGERALQELGLHPGSFDLEAVHESPAEVQWSCIADGVQASTGASAGKLNLRLREVARPNMQTVFRRKSTGDTVVFRLTPEFERRFVDLPRDRLEGAGAEVLKLPDEAIFSVQRPGGRQPPP